MPGTYDFRNDMWSGSEFRSVHQSVTVADVLSVLHRRRRIIQVAVVLGVAAAIGLRAHKATEYTATTLVMISPGDLNLISNAQAVTQGTVVDQTTLETQLQVIRSPDHIERVMKALRLFDETSAPPPVIAE